MLASYLRTPWPRAEILRTHYLNADFDLTLRARPRSSPRLERQASELSLQALLGAGDDDAVLVRREVPADFLEHLAACGLARPRILRHPSIEPDSRLRPYGWNDDAIALNARTLRPEPHPPPEVVRRVNGRAFGAAMEREVVGRDETFGRAFASPAEVERALTSEAPGTRWVVKAEHGNAALANRCVPAGSLAGQDARFVEACFEGDDRIVLEPWLERTRDLAAVFTVPFDARGLRIHEALCSRNGAMLGAWFEPEADTGSDEWRAPFAEAARAVAVRLHAEGYFGPVCLDGFVWRDGSRERLRPIVDVNARKPVSDAAHRAWRRLAPERTACYRFLRFRVLAAPDSTRRFVEALGPLRFDPATRRGVLLAAPPRLGEDVATRRPLKLALLLVEEDRNGVRRLERAFRSRFDG